MDTAECVIVVGFLGFLAFLAFMIVKQPQAQTATYVQIPPTLRSA